MLDLAESKLINSSSQQGSSIRQELVSTPLLHGFSVLRLAAFAFLGSLTRNQGLQIISLIHCQQMNVLEEISKPRLDERSLTLSLISAEF